ncbi:sugar phosphate isomerase/epimerase family protein [Ruegeria faecimaris]|uniref:sugar phosphate isomerase/epimerase family protein n=1 Tax=Ruegeria faecimaris TaxID=686389 RepID=UPI00249103AC|nr:sugar phosphate isomerase/epimerase [Ruegeria faecimaris]
MRVSAQLYTVRQVGDLAAQLDLVRACGFTDIETVGFHDLTPKQVTNEVRQAGFTVRSAHFDWEEFETRFDDILRMLEALECPVAVMPWLSPKARPGTAEGWKAVSGRLAEWAVALSANGVRLAYHNHDFDLVDLGQGSPLDMVLSHETIGWQPDIGWLYSALSDPAALLSRFSDRIVSVHAKDVDLLAGQGDERWRNLGQGVVDWPLVLRVLADSPCADLFVEHDETADHAQTLQTGHDLLMRMRSVEVT